MQGLIVGSYVVYILDHMTPLADRSHASLIRLKQALLSALRRQNKAKMAETIQVADKVWLDAMSENGGTYVLPGTLVETLYFNHEESLVATFGPQLTDLVLRYVEKHQNSNHAKESYMIADIIKSKLEVVKNDQINENSHSIW